MPRASPFTGLLRKRSMVFRRKKIDHRIDLRFLKLLKILLNKDFGHIDFETADSIILLPLNYKNDYHHLPYSSKCTNV